MQDMMESGMASLTRRDFLSGAAAFGLGGWRLFAAPLGWKPSKEPNIVFGVLADTHLRISRAGGYDAQFWPDTYLVAALKHFKEQNVYGVFRPESLIPFTPVLQDGATLDLSQYSGAWPLEGVRFASGVREVSLGASAYVRELARTKGYLLTYDEASDATFTLDASSGSYRINADVTGLKVCLRKGLINSFF